MQDTSAQTAREGGQTKAPNPWRGIKTNFSSAATIPHSRSG